MASASTGPVITGLSPEPGSINVNFNEKFIVTFNQSVKLGRGFFIFKNSNDDTEIARVDVKSILVNAYRNTVSVELNTDLSNFENIYIEITDGAITDQVGNPFEGITTSSWNFSGFAIIQDVQAGILIDAVNRSSYPEGTTFIRFEYSMTRSDNNLRQVCRIDYSGISKKPQRYLFPIGSKEILARFRLRKKQIRKLRNQGSQHPVTISMSCSDGSSDSHVVTLDL